MSNIIYIIVGARPNFIKIAPLIKEIKKQEIEYKLIHTGQHYDYKMSKIFFDELGIPEPDIHLNVGSASHAIQTAKIMIEFEKVLEKQKPSLVIVVGDVNSTIACALVAKKLFINIAHIEAGLRSFDMKMPEEINRILTDRISDLLFTTEESGQINLEREGIPSENIFFVGNIMIDTLMMNMEKAKNLNLLNTYSLKSKEYALLTLHRPSNVDIQENLEEIIKIIDCLKTKIKIFFPAHPRTIKNLKKYGILNKLDSPNIIISEPVGYLEFIYLISNAKLILTDSGGIQEEASFLKIPVITLRNSTERPITVEQGTNVIIGRDLELAKKYIKLIFTNQFKKGQNIEKWDGKTAQRIVSIIQKKIFMFP